MKKVLFLIYLVTETIIDNNYDFSPKWGPHSSIAIDGAEDSNTIDFKQIFKGETCQESAQYAQKDHR